MATWVSNFTIVCMVTVVTVVSNFTIVFMVTFVTLVMKVSSVFMVALHTLASKSSYGCCGYANATEVFSSCCSGVRNDTCILYIVTSRM